MDVWRIENKRIRIENKHIRFEIKYIRIIKINELKRKKFIAFFFI